jgi:hypothetical protein
MKLGMDNFVKTIRGYSTLANLRGIPGDSIEWVRDDLRNLDKLSAPGYYIVKMLTDTTFNVSPFLVIEGEELNIELIEGQKGAYLKNTPVNPDSEIIVSDNGIKFKYDIDYTIENSTGKIIFKTSIEEFDKILVDYQVIGEVSDEYETEIVIAFGDRLREGDEQVVVVDNEQRDIAKAYGGRWIMSCDLLGVAQDDDQQERIVDYAICEFWASWQNRLVDEGINVYDFSLSGESEDLAIESPEEYYYTGGISFTAEIDWELHVPLISEVRSVNIYMGNESFTQGLTHEKEAIYEASQFDNRMVNSGHQLGLRMIPSTRTVVFRPHPPIEVRTLKY